MKNNRHKSESRTKSPKTHADKNGQKQQVRIIAGEHRGRKLTFPAGTMVRPTMDRVRETLFNWLMHDIHGAVGLDLFAGSGAVSLEALSRGAAKVTMIEQDKSLAKTLQRHVDMLHYAAKSTVVCADARDWLANISAEQQFDVVWLDPPFDTFDGEAIDDICRQISDKCLKVGGICYLEQPKSRLIKELSQSHWQQLKHKTSGDVQYGLWQKL